MTNGTDGARRRKLVIFATEKLIRRHAHQRQLFAVRADATQDAENAPNQKRRFHQTLLDEIGKIIEITEIVAFEFESESRSKVAEALEDRGYILEGIFKDIALHPLEIRLLPI